MILSFQALRNITSEYCDFNPAIYTNLGAPSLTINHIQPASIDLPISNRCYRISVSSAPKRGESINSLIERFALHEFEIKPEGSHLEKGGTYLIPLSVSLNLPLNLRAVFSAKSTTGRNGLFARNMSDGNPELDVTPYGYNGELFVEVSPLRFHTTIYPWSPLTQLRLVCRNESSSPLTDAELFDLHKTQGLVFDQITGKKIDPVIEDGALYLHLDLRGKTAGYESIPNLQEPVHVGRVEVDDRESFWRPVRLDRHGDVVIQPPSFYLFATKERVFIPSEVSAVMQDYSANLGEFSSHEAGFFDNSFGFNDGVNFGTQAVLEVHPSRMPILLRDGHPVCRMVFYRTDGVPEKLYGGSSGSHYLGTGPSLAKNFKCFREW